MKDATPSAFSLYEKELDYIKKEKLFRAPTTYNPISATTVEKDGRHYLMMASNNYLGLTHHERVKKAAQEAIALYGTGSGGARLVSGSHPLFEALEKDLAHFKGTERAIVYNTGYMANVGTISALVGKGDLVISDELNHASIIDGCRLSGAQRLVYKHKDMKHLEELLREAQNGATSASVRLIVTDSVFSMDGDIAPLDELYGLATKYDALLLVDDAHATGVIGHGHGSAEHFNLRGKIHVQLGTLSKSLGSVGGFVATSDLIGTYLRNKARAYIFSTAISPADVGAAKEALAVIQDEPQLHEKLMVNIAYLKKALHEASIAVETETAIFPIITKDTEKTLAISKALYEKGIILSAIRPPTVPVNESRLRLTVTAAHDEEQLARVVRELRGVL